MSRKTKPCEYCEGDRVTLIEENIDNLSIGADAYPENAFLGFYIMGLSAEEKEVDLTFDIPMNFCPNCGRRLM